MEAAAGRVGRLAGHLLSDNARPGVRPSETSGDAFHGQCYSYEPGRLLLNQVGTAGQGRERTPRPWDLLRG